MQFTLVAFSAPISTQPGFFFNSYLYYICRKLDLAWVAFKELDSYSFYKKQQVTLAVSKNTVQLAGSFIPYIKKHGKYIQFSSPHLTAKELRR